MILYITLHTLAVFLFVLYITRKQEEKEKNTDEKLSNLVIHVASILSTGAEAEKRKLRATEELTDIMREVAKELHNNELRRKN